MASGAEFADERQEFLQLCESAGIQVIDLVAAARQAPHPRYFIGKGGALTLKNQVSVSCCELAIFNHGLTPIQQRNLEKLLECRVLDRTDLILDIFAQRARSFEGKLQVELAQLRHLSTRLVRGWTHLERQKGGIGLRGPGETQLETDRRLIGARIKKLAQRLRGVKSQREQGRRSRQKAAIPTVAVVGYTNAGKSTLFNRLTAGGVYIADQLFATLDPTLRRVELRGGSSIVLADTVGFIRDLPHDLIAAFRSTLAETKEADLLLHVVDAFREDRDECIRQVEKVLREVGRDDGRPTLMVYNKVDLTGRRAGIDRDESGYPTRVWLSALRADGLDCLSEALEEIFCRRKHHGWIALSPAESALRAELYRRQVVLAESYDNDGRAVLEVSIRDRDLEAAGLSDRLYADHDRL